MTHAELAELFVSVDAAEVRSAIDETATRLGLGHYDLTRAQVLQVLDELMTTQGILGVAARFAKARALLQPRGASSPPARSAGSFSSRAPPRGSGPAQK
jgi:hypothetical protein